MKAPSDVAGSLERGLELCKKLGLLETMEHGGDTYMRVTQKGAEVYATLVYMIKSASDPENVLKSN